MQFRKKWNFPKIFETLSFSRGTLSLVQVSTRTRNIETVRAQKHPKMAQFMDAASLRKHLKIYNLTTTNAIKIKLVTIVYLHETFHLAKYLGMALGAWEGVAKKPLKKSHKICFLA